MRKIVSFWLILFLLFGNVGGVFAGQNNKFKPKQICSNVNVVYPTVHEGGIYKLDYNNIQNSYVIFSWDEWWCTYQVNWKDLTKVWSWIVSVYIPYDINNAWKNFTISVKENASRQLVLKPVFVEYEIENSFWVEKYNWAWLSLRKIININTWPVRWQSLDYNIKIDSKGDILNNNLQLKIDDYSGVWVNVDWKIDKDWVRKIKNNVDTINKENWDSNYWFDVYLNWEMQLNFTDSSIYKSYYKWIEAILWSWSVSILKKYSQFIWNKWYLNETDRIYLLALDNVVEWYKKKLQNNDLNSYFEYYWYHTNKYKNMNNFDNQRKWQEIIKKLYKDKTWKDLSNIFFGNYKHSWKNEDWWVYTYYLQNVGRCNWKNFDSFSSYEDDEWFYYSEWSIYKQAINNSFSDKECRLSGLPCKWEQCKIQTCWWLDYTWEVYKKANWYPNFLKYRYIDLETNNNNTLFCIEPNAYDNFKKEYDKLIQIMLADNNYIKYISWTSAAWINDKWNNVNVTNFALHYKNLLELLTRTYDIEWIENLRWWFWWTNDKWIKSQVWTRNIDQEWKNYNTDSKWTNLGWSVNWSAWVKAKVWTWFSVWFEISGNDKFNKSAYDNWNLKITWEYNFWNNTNFEFDYFEKLIESKISKEIQSSLKNKSQDVLRKTIINLALLFPDLTYKGINLKTKFDDSILKEMMKEAKLDEIILKEIKKKAWKSITDSLWINKLWENVKKELNKNEFWKILVSLAWEIWKLKTAVWVQWWKYYSLEYDKKENTITYQKYIKVDYNIWWFKWIWIPAWYNSYIIEEKKIKNYKWNLNSIKSLDEIKEDFEKNINIANNLLSTKSYIYLVKDFSKDDKNNTYNFFIFSIKDKKENSRNYKLLLTESNYKDWQLLKIKDLSKDDIKKSLVNISIDEDGKKKVLEMLLLMSILYMDDKKIFDEKIFKSWIKDIQDKPKNLFIK